MENHGDDTEHPQHDFFDETEDERQEEVGSGLSRGDALRQAWETGLLDWKLREHQIDLYQFVSTIEALKTVIKCARRYGKTFTLLLYLIEMAIRHPGIRMRYAAPTEKSLRAYVKPNMRTILADCPTDLKPRWIAQDSMFSFVNGSELWLAGTDKEHAEKLRGPGTDLGVCDEAGFMSNLKYVVNDILLPSTMDCDGRLIIVSTPPRTPGHDFTLMFNEAVGTGSSYVKTVWENSWLMERPDKLAEYIEAAGGRDSTTWKREYECQDIIDEATAVIVEGNDNELMNSIIVDYPRPKYFNSVTSMDPGFSPSHTGCLYGYIDFENGLLVIEDELDVLRMRTDILATRIAKQELELGYSGQKFGRHMRWSDIDPRLLQDLATMHGLNFAATNKDSLPAMVNQARILISQKRIRIHPRCRSLIGQIRSATWNDSKSGFDWSVQYGHYDVLAAFIYMIRNADWTANPFPTYGNDVRHYSHHIPGGESPKGNAGFLAHAFRVGKTTQTRVLFDRGRKA